VRGYCHGRGGRVNVNDQWVAVVVGGGVVVALRVLDFFMPKGWVSKWTRRHADKADDQDTGDT
jgi:hypothetical protein